MSRIDISKMRKNQSGLLEIQKKAELILEQTLFCTTFPNFDLPFNFSAHHKTSLFRLAAYKIQKSM